MKRGLSVSGAAFALSLIAVPVVAAPSAAAPSAVDVSRRDSDGRGMIALPAADPVATFAPVAPIDHTTPFYQIGGDDDATAFTGATTPETRVFKLSQLGTVLKQSVGTLFGGEAPGGVRLPRLPEPVTWAMMLLGLGTVGGVLRRKVRDSERRFTEKMRRIAAGEDTEAR